MIRLNEKYTRPDGTLSQAGYDMLDGMERRIKAAETALAAANAKIAAAGAVASPTGGATIDAESRTAIVAIKAALS